MTVNVVELVAGTAPRRRTWLADVAVTVVTEPPAAAAAPRKQTTPALSAENWAGSETLHTKTVGTGRPMVAIRAVKG
jgi:hypothetical protein